MPSPARPREILRVLGLLCVAGGVALVLLLAATWFEHRIPMELPKPRGPFAVGRTSFHWRNAARRDEFAAASETPRELIVWVWYPATAGSGSPADIFPALGARRSPATAAY